MKTLRLLLGCAVLAILGGCAATERRLLFFPTHRDATGGLMPWGDGATTFGLAREVAQPRAVWLLLHGNAGQAADRVYALPAFSPHDAVYILEYPGYGRRDGTPSRESFNAAAQAAYRRLRAPFPTVPVGVVGESIGSGPACALASETRPPDKIVLLVPFDTLARVAEDHYPAWLTKILLQDNWDNVAALHAYRGPLEIFGARDDAVIPVAHARALAASRPQAVFHLLAGGHNDWSQDPAVAIRMR